MRSWPPAATPSVSPPLGTDSEITIGANSLFERITAEEIWACTSCKACDEICPVNIEILDKILDMRRYLSLMESNFPAELGNAYRAMENQGNPWGMNQGERGDWANDLANVTVVDPGEPLQAEYLYWVGCAGSFDDKNKKVTQAMAKLLSRAGIDVAILGPSEMCTGDSARRSGNEYLFQMLAMPNIEMLNGMGVKKIITQCPHCFNTLLNEYPQLGGNYEVVHHTQLLEQLIASGQLDVSQATLEERITYHDSCYLGRHNDVYLAPRKVVGSIKGIAGRRDAAVRHQGHVLRRRRRPHVDGGVDRHEGERRAGAGGDLHRRQPRRHRLPVLLHHARRRREGRRARRGPGEGRRPVDPPARRDRGRRAHDGAARRAAPTVAAEPLRAPSAGVRRAPVGGYAATRRGDRARQPASCMVGIGPAIEQILNDAGITTFAADRGGDGAALQDILPDLHDSRVEREDWIGQAQRFAAAKALGEDLDALARDNQQT